MVLKIEIRPFSSNIILCYFSIILGLVTQAWQFYIYVFTNFSIPIIQASAMTMLQEHVAPQMLGRVLSLPIIIYTGFIPLGMMIFGPMADVISINNLIIIAGIILLFLLWLSLFKTILQARNI